MEAANWETCRADFALDDGALIDLLAPGMGNAEWEMFWSALRAGPFKFRAIRDGESIPPPESVAWIYDEQKVASVSVSVQSGTVTAICHFFGGDEIMDIDPREVTSDTAFESVLAVMRFVSAAVGLSVLAVAEAGTPDHAFLRVSPNGQAVFLRPGSASHTEPVS